MNRRKLIYRPLGVLAALVVMLVAPTGAFAGKTPPPAPTPPMACPEPVVTQPFLSWNDANWYVIAPGQTAGNFDGTGWTLSGGAKIIQSTLYDGKLGSVLSTGNAGTAMSPPLCVNNLYPMTRMMVRGVNGGKANLSLSFQNFNGTWTNPAPIGSVTNTKLGWILSPQLRLPTASASGWVVARITIVGTGRTGADTGIYNLYVDPRLKR